MEGRHTDREQRWSRQGAARGPRETEGQQGGLGQAGSQRWGPASGAAAGSEAEAGPLCETVGRLCSQTFVGV